ncbi:hypothetical protein LTR56_010132 [Elasticomyces elasticus]|nr:hypothetical protein LTR56_010132 [Elasticomyces elasticus]KAK3658876.1 hypothetical protein LTR22_008701 [Elasticomyces elasticus]KAK4923018.1 hypothetical protein LTR49_009680 [Elasticomyces elasticus]KAK5758088.1 hypothetical protein LTS12_011848 [Elasticomyces elasticus]
MADTDQSVAKKPKLNASYPVPAYDDATERDVAGIVTEQHCFAEVLTKLREICDILPTKFKELEALGLKDNKIFVLIERLGMLADVQNVYPTPSTVGFLGRTSAAKSSCINSLLSSDQVAAESATGSSGTKVPQELTIADRDQKHAVKANVYYMSSSQILAEVKRCVNDIVMFNYTSNDYDDESPEEFKETLHQAELARNDALQFLTTILCDAKDFKDIETTALYFEDVIDEKDPKVISDIQNRIETYLRFISDFFTTAERYTTFQDDEMKNVQDKMRSYLGPVTPAQGTTPPSSPYPLATKVDTQVKSRVLSSGLKLVDLPGTSDTDRRIVENTTKYIKKCDIVVIVETIERIQTQAEFWKNIDICMKLRKHGKVILVATKIDEIHVEHDDMTLPDAVREEIRERRAAMHAKKAEAVQRLSEFNDWLRNAALPGGKFDAQEFSKLSTAKDEADQEAKEDVAKFAESLIVLRNNNNAAKVQKLYPRYSRTTAQVPIHFVSSWQYTTHLNGFDLGSLPKLTLEKTGIPGLRTHLLKTDADRLLREVMKLCKRDIPVLLASLHGLCSRDAIELKAQLESEVSLPLDEFNKLLASTGQQMKTSVDGLIDATLTAKMSTWRDKSKNAFAKYTVRAVSHHTIKAFCHNQGHWYMDKRTKEKIYWNHEILEQAEPDLIAMFQQIESALTPVVQKITTQVEASLTTLAETLQTEPNLPALGLGTLTSSIERIRGAVQQDLAQLTTKLVADVAQVGFDTYSHDSDTVIFTELAKPSYDLCKDDWETGPGSDNKGFKQRYLEVMKKEFHGHFNIFGKIVKEAKTMLHGVVETWVKEAEGTVGNNLKSIVDDFENRFDNTVVLDEFGMAQREELLGFVSATEARLIAEVVPLLEQCESFTQRA